MTRGDEVEPQRRPSFLVVGESLVDVVHTAEGARSERAGGSPANVAVGLARLDHPTTLVTAFGRDRLGAVVEAHLTSSGVQVVRDERSTSSAVARIDDSGTASYEFDVRWELEGHPVPPSVTLLHTGSIAAVLEPGASTVRRMVDEARERSAVSYDINARPALMGSPEEARVAVETMGALADVVKASDEDLAWLYPGLSLEEVASTWLAPPLGCLAFVVSRGVHGATAYTADVRLDVQAGAVEVVDTIGAGDSFMAGLLTALAERGLVGAHRRTALADLDRKAWSEILEFAVRCAAVTVGRSGADPPTTAELGGDR